MRQSIPLLILILLSAGAFAQKGAPEKSIVNINHSTNYAQHVDFSPTMLSQLKTYPGFKVSIAASGLGKPRVLCLLSPNKLYISRRDAGDILLLTDLDGDHHFDELKTVVSDFKGVHGLALRDGWLYACNNRELKRFHIDVDGLLGEEQLLINDLPDGGQHPNRTIGFGPDGKLYLSVGSTCNDCFDSNKENATMLQIDPLTWKRVVYARGLRNTIGFDWSPADQQMYGADNGGDAKGDAWPPEELNRIQQDKDYGWPLVYGKQEVDNTREEPMGTSKDAYAKLTEPSLLEFPAHAAPMSFKFLNAASDLPATLKDDALVCWHGSWNRKDPSGFKVQIIHFENGKPVNAEDFLSGFYNPTTRTRFGRPFGLAIAADGAIYISDDANGVLYCVTSAR